MYDEGNCFIIVWWGQKLREAMGRFREQVIRDEGKGRGDGKGESRSELERKSWGGRAGEVRAAGMRAGEG